MWTAEPDSLASNASIPSTNCASKGSYVTSPDLSFFISHIGVLVELLGTLSGFIDECS